MNQFLLAVADGTKARFLTLNLAEFPEYEPNPQWIEHECLLNSAQELQGQELWASAKTGRNRGVGGQAHSYDDRRQNHMMEFERRFAQTIATQLVHCIQAHPVQQLFLIAEPQFLGLMRNALIPLLPKNIKMSELAKNLCHLKPHELYEYLVSKQLLPGQKLA